MEWISVEDRLPEPHTTVLVNDLNGEGVLLAWRAEWHSNGQPNGDWQWCFQIQGLEHEEVNIRNWCEYPQPPQ